jgi:predicted acyl esterase
MRRAVKVCVLLVLTAMLVVHVAGAQDAVRPDAKVESVWRVQEFMVPMRDGVHLQTVVIIRKGETRTLPILMERTPYGIPSQEGFDEAAAKNGGPEWVPPSWKELAEDGYILVFQNLRGRFKSEGVFLMSSQYDPNDPKQAKEPLSKVEFLLSRE